MLSLSTVAKLLDYSMPYMHSVLDRTLAKVLHRVECMRTNTYVCTVFSALRFARVSARVRFVHVMALFSRIHCTKCCLGTLFSIINCVRLNDMEVRLHSCI